MKERILNNKMFVAYATPIISVDKYGYYEYGDSSELFIIYPVVKRSPFGKERIVGGLEAISNIKLFNCDIVSESNTLIFEDVESKEYNIGGIKWDVNMNESADKVLTSEELKQYFSQTPGNILDRIINMRKRFKELSESKRKILK